MHAYTRSLIVLGAVKLHQEQNTIRMFVTFWCLPADLLWLLQLWSYYEQYV